MRTRLERLSPLVPLVGILVGTLATLSGCAGAPKGLDRDMALTACHEYLDTLTEAPENPVEYCLEAVR